MKGILKKVLIGVLIGIILMLVRKTLFIDVYADELQNNVRFDYPPDKQVENYNDRLYTNFAQGMLDNNTLYAPKGGFLWQERKLDSPNDTSYANLHTLELSTLYDHNYQIYGTNQINIGYYAGITTFNLWNNRWSSEYSDRHTNFPISKGHTYEILVEFKKSSNLTWYANSDTINLSPESTTIYAFLNGTETTLNNQLDIKWVKWVSPSSLGNGKEDTAYFHLRFEFQDVATSNTFYLSRINFDCGDTVGLNYGDSFNYTPFVFNTSNDTGLLRINSLSFIEDGYINISPPGNDAVGIMPGLDSTSMEDLNLFADYEDCDPLDIACHVRNIQTALQDIIIRIGNFFYNIVSSIVHLFVPNENDLGQINRCFNSIFEFLEVKLGFLAYPFTLFSDVVNRLITLASGNYNSVINIPALIEPFSNTTIWNGGTLDLGAIFHTGNIGTFYTIYRSFISVYLILLFINLCYDAFGSFISGNIHTSSSYTISELNNIDEQTGEVYSYTRVRKTNSKTLSS